jgi:hypothetical protein
MPYLTKSETLKAILVNIQNTTKEPQTLELVNQALSTLRSPLGAPDFGTLDQDDDIAAE